MEGTEAVVPDRDESPTSESVRSPEIASVVFLDIVGYSRLSIDRQSALIGQLRKSVQQTGVYRAAKQRGNLLPLPTGDGMALVFFESPLIAVECAIEIATALHDFPDLKLRTGVHMGPVSRTTAINDEMNVAGGGINIAQRVMDSGDAGHILISKTIADILLEMDAWRGHVVNLGDHKVKHGVVIRLYNLAGSGFGNPAKPAKLKRTGAWKTAAILLLCAMPAILAISYFSSHRPPKLTDKDTLVLADFKNTTGDPVFDGALRQGLAVELEQSPFVSLISDVRIQRILAQMKQPADSRLTPALAREICERTASAAFLEGSIESLGSQYVLGLRAENCHTGDVLADEQARASRKEGVLDALTHIASKFRTQVGEALATVRQHETPLEEATTPSLEALKAYSTAAKLNYTKGPAAALPHFQRAVAIDPQFAIAYAYLGLMYSNMGESDLAAASTRKAYQLRDRTSDRERFNIALTYDRQVTGNLEKEGQTAALWAQTYPRDVSAHALWAGYATSGTGKYEKAIEEAEITIGLDPDQVYGYTSIANSNLRLGRFPEVEKALARAAANHMDMSHPNFCMLRFYLAFFRNDEAGMEREVAQSRGRSGVEDAIAHGQALVLARAGRLRQAGETWQRARESARQTGKRETAGIYEAAAAVCDAVYGRAAEARKRAHAALELSKGRDVEYGAAFALAVAGDSAVSQALADNLKKRFPEDTSVQFSYLPTLGALFALAHGDHAMAIETLQVAHTYEFGLTGIAFFGFFGGLHPAYVRGEAYLAAHQGAEAATEFQKILDHPGIVISDPIGALAHLQLGRAFALSGDKTKAEAAYKDFLTLWKDADPDIPILRQAKVEYGKLR